MGAEVYPVFNPAIPTATFAVDGKRLLREHRVLDEIAIELGRAAFSSFGDNRAVPRDFDSDPGELEDLFGRDDIWYCVDDGLKSIEAILDAIVTRPEVASRLAEPRLLSEDLGELVRCLHIAREFGAVSP